MPSPGDNLFCITEMHRRLRTMIPDKTVGDARSAVSGQIIGTFDLRIQLADLILRNTAAQSVDHADGSQQ